MPTPGGTFLRALDELSDAWSKGDDLGVRQASEKAWLAVVEATDSYLLAKHNISVPLDRTAHMERRKYLRATDRGDLEVTYGHLADTLHGDVFYFGESVGKNTMRTFLEEAADFIEQTTGVGGLQGVVQRITV